MKISFSPNISHVITRGKTTMVQLLSQNKHWIFIVLCAYAMADLLVLASYPYFLSAQTRQNFAPIGRVTDATLTEYVPIWDFNVFHNGAIPPSMASQNSQKPKNNEPVRSLLPLVLNGTIVYQNPILSRANITVKSQKNSQTYQTDDKIEALARITHITGKRVYFINLTNNTQEYVEVADLPSANLQFRNKFQNTQNALTGQKSLSQKRIDRSFINRHLRSLSKVLQQARVVPHWEHGRMVGYRFQHIDPGSPYEKLGFQVSDVIKSVEGEPVRSELQAAEMFHRLKNTSSLKMTIQRGGQEVPFTWMVNEDSGIEDTSGIRFK